jgi:ribosomal protein L11
MAARYENLGQAAAVHGLDPDNLVKELNEKTENA